jgi:hypothetical protein
MEDSMKPNWILHQGKCYKNCRNLSIGVRKECIIEDKLFCTHFLIDCRKEIFQRDNFETCN